MNQRHMEFFGPDLGRGPFAPSQMEVAAVQMATAIAQLRAPLSRADDDVLAHADFIRQLADRLAPDYANYVKLEVVDIGANKMRTYIRTAINTYSLLTLWLADVDGGGVTLTEPDAVTFNTGTALQTIVSRKHFVVLTSPTGIVDVTVEMSGAHTWYWGVARQGRVFYSRYMSF